MKNCEPKSFTLGESLRWEKWLGHWIPNEDWTVTYYFRGVGKGFDVIGTTEDWLTFVFDVASATTAQMQIGGYSWQLVATNNFETILLDSGTVEVKAGLATTDVETIFDGRSENKKTLDAIRAMIAGKATLDQQEYAIGNRQLKRIPITDLIALESNYAQKVARENQAARLKKGGKMFKQVHIRMK